MRWEGHPLSGNVEDRRLQEGPYRKARPTLGERALKLLGALGNIVDLPGSSVRDTIGGVGDMLGRAIQSGDWDYDEERYNPFDQWATPTTSQNRVYGRDLLERAGVLEKNTPGLDGGDIAGLGVDLFTDPFNLGMLGRSFGTARAGSKARAANRQAISQANFQNIANTERTGIANRAIAGERVDALANNAIRDDMIAKGALPNELKGKAVRVFNKANYPDELKRGIPGEVPTHGELNNVFDNDGNGVYMGFPSYKDLDLGLGFEPERFALYPELIKKSPQEIDDMLDDVASLNQLITGKDVNLNDINSIRGEAGLISDHYEEYLDNLMGILQERLGYGPTDQVTAFADEIAGDLKSFKSLKPNPGVVIRPPENLVSAKGFLEYSAEQAAKEKESVIRSAYGDPNPVFDTSIADGDTPIRESIPPEDAAWYRENQPGYLGSLPSEPYVAEMLGNLEKFKTAVRRIGNTAGDAIHPAPESIQSFYVMPELGAVDYQHFLDPIQARRNMAKVGLDNEFGPEATRAAELALEKLRKKNASWHDLDQEIETRINLSEGVPGWDTTFDDQVTDLLNTALPQIRNNTADIAILDNYGERSVMAAPGLKTYLPYASPAYQELPEFLPPPEMVEAMLRDVPQVKKGRLAALLGLHNSLARRDDNKHYDYFGPRYERNPNYQPF